MLPKCGFSHITATILDIIQVRWKMFVANLFWTQCTDIYKNHLNFNNIVLFYFILFYFLADNF